MNNELKIALISSISTLIIALASGYLSYLWSTSSQKKIHSHQTRLHAYSDLLGYKQLIPQLIVSRFEAFILSDYHEYKWHINGNPKESIDLSEATRWMHKSEDYVIEISKTVQNLFVTIGEIRVVFKYTPELNKLCDNVYNFKTIKFEQRPSKKWTLQELEEWKEKAIRNIKILADDTMKVPIDNLAKYLEKELQNKYK